MAPVRKTSLGYEVTKQFTAIALAVVSMAGMFVGITAAGVRAADQLKGTASKTELHDSVRAIRSSELVTHIADSVHEASQDSATSWYARQTWRLICKQSGNPEAFCSSAAIVQQGRPR